MTTDQVFPGELQSVSAFRRFVVTALTMAGLPETVVEDARLLASELGTNAIAHSRSGLSGGKYVGKVEIGAVDVLIVVEDEGETTGQDDVDADEHGRGLVICRSIGELITEDTGTGRRTAVRIPLAPHLSQEL